MIVLSQEEARLLNHGHCGTEHLLLGLLSEGEGVAAKVLTDLGVTLGSAREAVEKSVPKGTEESGYFAYSERAKKVLELSLREALQMGHNYIGTEHILLGLIREGTGIGATVLVELGLELAKIRQAVIQVVVLAPPTRAPKPSGDVFMTGLQERARAFGTSRLVKDPDPEQDLLLKALEVSLSLNQLLWQAVEMRRSSS